MSVSFVIAAYNIERYIAECLHSVLASLEQDDEVIVVNDGSTDGTLRIAQELLAGHASASILTKPNGGLSSARNAGLAAASKTYVLFLDGDDALHSATVARARPLLQEAAADIIVFDYQEWLNDGAGPFVPSRPRSHVPAKLSRVKADNLRQTLEDCIPCVWTRFFKRTLFEHLPPSPFPEWLMYDDLPTTPKLVACASSMLYIPEPLVNYRIRPGSLTKQRTARSCTDMIKAALEAASAISALPSDPGLRTSADLLVARKMLDAIKQCRELRPPTRAVYDDIVDQALPTLSANHAALAAWLQASGKPSDRTLANHLKWLTLWRWAYVSGQLLVGKVKAMRARR